MTRRCHAITKAGKKCRAAPIKGTDYCLAHNAEARRSTRFILGVSQGGGRPAKPRAVDVLRERVERRIDEILDPLFDALRAVSGYHVVDDEVISDPDHAIRLRAAAEILDRVYGKPKQTAEISGPAGEPLRPAVALDDPAVLAALDVVRARLRERERDAG